MILLPIPGYFPWWYLLFCCMLICCLLLCIKYRTQINWSYWESLWSYRKKWWLCCSLCLKVSYSFSLVVGRNSWGFNNRSVLILNWILSFAMEIACVKDLAFWRQFSLWLLFLCSWNSKISAFLERQDQQVFTYMYGVKLRKKDRKGRQLFL